MLLSIQLRSAAVPPGASAVTCTSPPFWSDRVSAHAALRSARAEGPLWPLTYGEHADPGGDWRGRSCAMGWLRACVAGAHAALQLECHPGRGALDGDTVSGNRDARY